MLPSRKKEGPVIQGVLAAVPMKISASMCLRVGCKECAVISEELVSLVTKIPPKLSYNPIKPLRLFQALVKS
jgi:hypothetical protein